MKPRARKSAAVAPRRLVRWLVAGAMGLVSLQTLAADEAAFNPKPEDTDVVLPMPGDFKMVFVKVPIPGTGFWGGGERIFEAGGSEGGAFESPRAVRIGGTFRSAEGASFLVMGKYEVTFGQYATVMGDGDIEKGLEALRQGVGESVKIPVLSPTLSANAKATALRVPVNSLSQDEYLAFIARYNKWCIAEKSCLDAMREQLGDVGFFRLPMEHEWEFVARGGEAGVKAKAALPFPFTDIERYAYVDASGSNLPNPIGKREPLLGIYDIYGNVAELMGEPFTMDNGSGSVGGGVVRGGSFRSRGKELRASRREEVPPYNISSDGATVSEARRPTTGLRLMIGSPVKTTPATIAKIEEEFKTKYIAIAAGGGADCCGNSYRTAKDLARLTSGKAMTLSDSVGGDDTADFYKLNTGEFGNLAISLSAINGEVDIELKATSWEQPVTIVAGAGEKKSQTLENIAPDSLTLKVIGSKPGTQYQAEVSFQSNDPAGNVAREAQDLGTLEGKAQEIVQFVGQSDKADFYKFSLGSQDNISIRIENPTSDVNVELLGEAENKLAESVRPRNESEKIELSGASPGVYYVRVYSSDDKPATYRMLLAKGVIDTCGDSFETACDKGTVLSEQISNEEYLGEGDQADYYKVTLGQDATVKARVSQISQDVDVYLYDATGTELRLSRHTGTEPEELTVGLKQGTYYVAVRTDGAAQTKYFFTLEVRKVEAYADPDLPYDIGVIGSSPSLFTSTINDDAAFRYVLVRVDQSGSLKATLDFLKNDAGTNVDFDMYRITRTGAVVSGYDKVSESLQPEGVSEIMQAAVTPGEYLIQVRRDRGKSSEFRLSVSTSIEALDPTFAGRTVGSFGDWVVGVEDATDTAKKWCFAYTIAKQHEPTAWRSVKPYLFLGAEAGGDGVAHRFDLSDDYDESRGWTVDILTKGRSLSISVMKDPAKDSTAIKALEKCNGSSGWCVVNKALQGLTRGYELTMTGTTRDGRSSRIVYSLSGYTKAIRAMNSECGNTKNLSWLIQ